MVATTGLNNHSPLTKYFTKTIHWYFRFLTFEWKSQHWRKTTKQKNCSSWEDAFQQLRFLLFVTLSRRKERKKHKIERKRRRIRSLGRISWSRGAWVSNFCCLPKLFSIFLKSRSRKKKTFRSRSLWQKNKIVVHPPFKQLAKKKLEVSSCLNSSFSLPWKEQRFTFWRKHLNYGS